MIKEQALQPVSHETAGVDGIPGSFSQGPFQRSERTDHPEPRLKDYHADGRKVAESEPGIFDPVPPPKTTNNNEDKTQDNKANECGMCQENDVGDNSIENVAIHTAAYVWQRVIPLSYSGELHDSTP